MLYQLEKHLKKRICQDNLAVQIFLKDLTNFLTLNKKIDKMSNTISNEGMKLLIDKMNRCAELSAKSGQAEVNFDLPQVKIIYVKT